MGVRYRSNGKEVESNRVKSLERIKVSFNVADNQVAVQGPRDFYLRVINLKIESHYLSLINHYLLLASPTVSCFFNLFIRQIMLTK